MLKNKVAIVTGGTRGIGYAVVEKFLENGATVILFGSREETVKNSLEKLKKKYPDKTISGYYPNLQNYSEVRDTINKILATYQKIDILVNNAGVSDSLSIFDYEEDHFKKIMDLNVNGLFNCTRAVVDSMKKNGGGVILNASSMVSISGQTIGVAYPTSKFAVNGLTVSLARELGPHNIRVNAVGPGITNTDMVANLSDEMIQPLINNIPLRRIGEPEDVANAYLFLASDMASYVTGTVLRVDGAMRV